MLSSLSGFAKRLSSYIREPLTALGTAVQNGVYTDEYSVPDYPTILHYAENTIDPNSFEEVWIVMSKALTTEDNNDARNVMNITDFLFKNCSEDFCSTCTPYFMKCIKDMINMKSKDTTDEGTRLAQEFCCVIAQWKQMFSSSSHPEKVKVILDGIEDMEKSGLTFSSTVPIEKEEEEEEDISSLPIYSGIQMAPELIRVRRDSSGVGSALMKSRVGFDPKILYRNVKRLMIKLNEYGEDLFLQPEARNVCLMCTMSQPELQELINREVILGTNEKLVNRLLLVNDLVLKVSERYSQFQKKYSLDQVPMPSIPAVADFTDDAGECDDFLALWIADDKREALHRSKSEPLTETEKPKIRKVLSQVLDLLSSDADSDDEEPEVSERKEEPKSLMARFTSSSLWPGSWATRPQPQSPPPKEINDMMGVDLVEAEPTTLPPRVAQEDLLDDLFMDM